LAPKKVNSSGKSSCLVTKKKNKRCKVEGNLDQFDGGFVNRRRERRGKRRRHEISKEFS